MTPTERFVQAALAEGGQPVAAGRPAASPVVIEVAPFLLEWLGRDMVPATTAAPQDAAARWLAGNLLRLRDAATVGDADPVALVRSLGDAFGDRNAVALAAVVLHIGIDRLRAAGTTPVDVRPRRGEAA